MNRKKLVGTLEVVNRAIESNNLIPMYKHFCFTGETVFGWNDAFGIVAPCKMPEPFAVEAGSFLGWLKSLKDDKINIEIDGAQLHMSASKSSEFNVSIKGPEDFVWKEPDLGKGGELDNELIRGIEFCLPTASSNLALGNFNRITITPKDGKLAVYSTDGDGFTRYITAINGDAVASLSKEACEAIVKTGTGKLLIRKDWVCSLYEDYKVYAPNLLPVTFEYEKYINQILEGEVPQMTTFPVGDKLQEALTRARVVADIETSPTTITITHNKVNLTTQTPFGITHDEVKLNDKHPDIEASAHAAMLMTNMTDCNEFRVMSKCCAFKGRPYEGQGHLLRLVSVL